MKKPPASKPASESTDQLGHEYQFDYSKAKPNRFASQFDQTKLMVALDTDVSVVFTTQEAVNKALRALIEVMPQGVNPPNQAVN